MSYRPLLAMFALWPVLHVSHAVAQSVCKPKYQVTQAPCRDSEEVLSYTTVIDRQVVVNKGACKVPNPVALCAEYIPRFQAANPKAERIEVSNPTKDPINEVCGDPFKKIQQKVNVACDFTYQLPQYRKVADPNCPVQQIQDVNGCFDAKAPTLDPAAISECLSLKVVTKADLWIKGVCLHDISRAALNIEISAADFEQVQSKLAILKRKIQGNPEFAQLAQILEAK